MTHLPKRLPILALAFALAACTAVPGARTRTGTASRTVLASTAPSIGLPPVITGGGLISDHGAGLISHNGGSLIGKVKIPNGVISNNAGGLVSNNSGGVIANNAAGLISDHGAGILSNNASGLIANNSGGLIGNNAGGYRLSQAEPPSSVLVQGEVVILDASGQPVLDEAGKPYVAKTDSDGNYRFERSPRGRNLLVGVSMPAAVGPMVAFLPDASASAPRTASVDGVSTMVMGYILQKFVVGQKDPLAVLDKLPANEETIARQAALSAAAGQVGLKAFQVADVVGEVDALRAKDVAFDAQVKKVQALLVAGQSDLGDGLKATAVALSSPKGLALLPDGRLLFAERNGPRLRVVTKEGLIATFAGKSNPVEGDLGDGKLALDASFFGPNGCAVAKDGTVWVADFLNNRIRRIDGKTGVVTTAAGTGVAGNVQDGTVATQAPLDHPSRVVLDANERPVFFAGGYAGVLRLEANGTLKKLSLGGPDVRADGLTRGADGKVYAYATKTGEVMVLEGDAFRPVASVLPKPGVDGAAFAVGADGQVYLGHADRILRFNGSAWGELPLDPVGMGELSGFLIDGDRLWLCEGANRVWQLPLAGGRPTLVAGLADASAPEVVEASAIAFNKVGGLFFDLDGRLVVADTMQGVVWRRRTDGKYERLLGTRLRNFISEPLAADGTAANRAALGGIAGLAQAPDGTYFFAEVDPVGGRLASVGRDGLLKALPMSADFKRPAYLSREANGNLLVSDYDTGFLMRVKPDGSATSVAPNVLVRPAITLPLPDGSFYASVNDHLGVEDHNAIVLVKPDGTTQLIAGGRATGFAGDGGLAVDATLYGPVGMALDTKGRLLFADAKNNRIRRIDLSSGIITTVVGAGTNLLSGSTPDTSLKDPLGLAFAPNGDLYIADSGHNQIKAVRAADLPQ